MISIAENKDCMAAMAEFPDKFFDLAIVDPPYGIGYDGAKKAHQVTAEEGKNLLKDGITKRQMSFIFQNYLGYQKIKLFGALTI
jgi:DNA modification methylase